MCDGDIGQNVIIVETVTYSDSSFAICRETLTDTAFDSTESLWETGNALSIGTKPDRVAPPLPHKGIFFQNAIFANVHFNYLGHYTHMTIAKAVAVGRMLANDWLIKSTVDWLFSIRICHRIVT